MSILKKQGKKSKKRNCNTELSKDIVPLKTDKNKINLLHSDTVQVKDHLLFFFLNLLFLERP